MPTDTLSQVSTDTTSSVSTDTNIATDAPNSSGKPTDPSVTFIKNVGELQEKAPEVYNAMMMGMAMTICKDMREHQEHIKKLNREARQHN